MKWSTKQFLWGVGGWAILMACGMICMGYSDINPSGNNSAGFFFGAAVMHTLARSEARHRGWKDDASESPQPTSDEERR